MNVLFLLTLFSCRTDTTSTKEQAVVAQVEDKDQDGYPADQDCNDSDATINPDAAEVCDGIDNNCNEAIDDDDEQVTDLQTFYLDADGDNFGVTDETIQACTLVSGYAEQAGDCDDDNPLFYPSAPEEDCADPNDYNCDGEVVYVDSDGDGWAACVDCNDEDSTISPEQEEVCDEIDNNCDGQIDEGVKTLFYLDADGDGFGDANTEVAACEAPQNYITDATDCNDASELAYPGADEVCDELDNNCDGNIDEDTALDAANWYADTDGDGFGDASVVLQSCTQPTGYVADSTDCDDGEGSTYPGAVESCDTVDSDCDGAVAENDSVDALTWYADTDGDGFGDASAVLQSCTQPTGYVADSTDCDDGEGSTYPGAVESCDTVDSDCDGAVAENDSVDTLTWYADTDGDGFGDAAVSQQACSEPSDYVADATDCDDDEQLINPSATEIADGIDQDCDTIIDNNTEVFDDDGDGYSEEDGDCDDGNQSVYPGAVESCDSIDSDCNGDLVDSFDNLDGDDEPDCIDADADGDNIDDSIDNCPLDNNPGQYDLDQDGDGDACDPMYQCPMLSYTQNVPCYPPFGNGSGCLCECNGQVQSDSQCLHSGNINGLYACQAPHYNNCTQIVNNECTLYNGSNGTNMGTIPCDSIYP